MSVSSNRRSIRTIACLPLALGIFHCVSKFKLIFLIAPLSRYRSLPLLALSGSLSHWRSLSEIATGTQRAIVLFICVILIYSPRTIVLRYYVNATAALTYVCECLYLRVCVCVCVYCGKRHSLFISMFLGFSLIYLPYAPFCFALFLLLCISNIRTHVCECARVCVLLLLPLTSASSLGAALT